MRPVFIPISDISIDPSKENVAILAVGIMKNDHIYGFVWPLIRYLSKRFNVVTIAKGSADELARAPNVFRFDDKSYDTVKATMPRAVDMPGHVDHNDKVLREMMEASFGEMKMKHIFVMGGDALQLPLTSYVRSERYPVLNEMMNEFHDYVGDDPGMIEEIEAANVRVVREQWGRRCSPLTYVAKNVAVFAAVILHFFRRSADTHVFAFVIDPTLYTPFLRLHGIPHTYFYFADDSRGTRDFKRFPIAELQHLVHEPSKQTLLDRFDPLAVPKTHDFFFVGTVFQQKGYRREMWSTFLRGLRLERSSLFIPLTMNRIVYDNKKTKHITTCLEKAQEQMADVYEEVNSHPMYAGHIFPSQLRETLARYKYGFVARCVSHYDSLNYRVVYYLSLGILPLLDEMYDPARLMVPEEFQARLRVASHADIAARVEHFNSNDAERAQLLAAMRAHYQIEEFPARWEAELDKYIP